MQHLTLTSLLLLALAIPSLVKAEANPPALKTKPDAGAHSVKGSEAQKDPAQSALNEAKVKLGSLEPWQRILFEEEVLPQSSKFIKESRSDQAEVDLEALKKYLAFYAPKALKKDDPKIAVFIQTAPDCTACQDNLPLVQKTVKSRLERRGFVPIWITAKDLGEELNVKNGLDKLTKLSSKKGAQATCLVQLKQIIADAFDTAHADEKHFQIRVALAVKHVGSEKSEKAEDGSLELLEEDSMVVAVDKLFTDALTTLGAQQMAGAETVAESSALFPELLVQISGIKGFDHYNEVQTQLRTAISSFGNLVERKVSRGTVTFALKTKKTIEDLKKAIVSVSLGSEHLTANQIDPSTIVVELK